MGIKFSVSHLIEDTWAEKFFVQLTFNIQGEPAILHMRRSRLSHVSFTTLTKVVYFLPIV